VDSSPVPAFQALVLEDHDFQRRIACQVLRQCGATAVLEAADATTALALLSAADAAPDILLCDLKMPGMDGLAFLRHLAQRRCSSSVILASAVDPDILRAAEIMARSYGIRMLGTLDKPLSRAKLVPMLLRHFSLQRSRSKAAEAPLPLDEIRDGVSRGQFIPFFQPKVDVRSGSLVGVEALMRWRHPERGWLRPAAFIPVMEAEGLINAVTTAVIERALEFSRHWRAQGLDVPIAINVSVASLHDTELPNRLEEMTQHFGIPENCITIEVTETVAMTDLGQSLETLARCRMKGFALSIDDYGTGFSSMQQLTRLPVSELKIDQSFVTGCNGEAILQALIETSIALAQRLGLKTVAEGVETQEDWEVIARLGCDCAQGYFIARPMAGEHLPEWHANWLGVRAAPRNGGGVGRGVDRMAHGRVDGMGDGMTDGMTDSGGRAGAPGIPAGPVH
jgi:EAL domain-containing protein (putative c-di-GMP-specific phosphodiesterase class I)/FixJ family two-component response regulator